MSESSIIRCEVFHFERTYWFFCTFCCVRLWAFVGWSLDNNFVLLLSSNSWIFLVGCFLWSLSLRYFHEKISWSYTWVSTIHLFENSLVGHALTFRDRGKNVLFYWKKRVHIADFHCKAILIITFEYEILYFHRTRFRWNNIQFSAFIIPVPLLTLSWSFTFCLLSSIKLWNKNNCKIVKTYELRVYNFLHRCTILEHYYVVQPTASRTLIHSSFAVNWFWIELYSFPGDIWYWSFK